MRRIISLTLTAFIMLSIFVSIQPMAAENDVETVAGTVPSHGMQKAAAVLQSLGIVDETVTDYPDAIVSRLGFVETVARALKIDAGSMTQAVYYTDVIGKSVVNDLTAIGILKGRDDKLFNPNDAVTVAEARVIALRVLGYGAYMEVNGGEGFTAIQLANRIDLMSENLSDGDKVTNGVMLDIIHNMLTSKTYRAISFGDILHFDEGANLMEEVYDVYIARGYVEANAYTSVYKDVARVRAGELRINNVTYSYSSLEAPEYLGKQVKYYYNDEFKEILYIDYDGFEEEELFVADENVISYSNDTLNYFDKSLRKRSVSFDIPVVVYNGIAHFDYTDEEIEALMKQDRTVIRTNKDDEDKRSVIFINTFHNGQVAFIDDEKTQLYLDLNIKVGDEYGVKLYFDMDDGIESGKVRVRNAVSGEADIEALVTGAGVSCCYDETGEYLDIWILSEMIMGEIKAIHSESDGEYIMEVGDTVYPVDKDLMAMSSFVPGNEVEVYRDIFGYLAVCKKAPVYNASVGVIYYLSKDVFNNIKCRIYNGENMHIETNFAQKVIVDGKRLTAKQAYDKLMGLSIAGGLRVGAEGSVLIGYKLNKDGNVSMIDTAEDTSDGRNTLHRLNPLDRLVMHKDAANGSYHLQKKFSLKADFQKNYPVSTAAMAIAVPSVAADNKTSQKAFYKNFSLTGLTGEKEFAVELYNFDGESPFVEVALMDVDPVEMTVSYDAPVYMVADFLTALDEEGNPRIILGAVNSSGYSSSLEEAMKSFTMADTVAVWTSGEDSTIVSGLNIMSFLDEGDIVQMETNVDGLVHGINLLYDYSEDSLYTNDETFKSYEVTDWNTYVSNYQTCNRYLFDDIDEIYQDLSNPMFLTFCDEKGNLKEMFSLNSDYFRYPIYDHSLPKRKVYVSYLNEIVDNKNTNGNGSRVFVIWLKLTPTVFFYR